MNYDSNMSELELDIRRLKLERETAAGAMDELADMCLGQAKKELYLNMRYLFLALNYLETKADKRFAFTSCDGKTFYYNPLNLVTKYRDDPVYVNRAFLHSTLHCLFKHMYLFKNKKEDIWDLACDIAIEYIIDSMENSALMRVYDEKREEIYKDLSMKNQVMSAQNVYMSLLSWDRKKLEKVMAMPIFEVDDHEIWYDSQDQNQDKKQKQSQDGNQDKDQDKESDDDIDKQVSAAGRLDENSKNWEKLSKNIESALSFSSGMSKDKNCLKRALNASNHKEVSYKDFLMKFARMSEEIKPDLDSFDYGYYSYGLRTYGNMPLIEELEYSEKERLEDFCLVIDTSGSCARGLIEKFFATTFEILNEKGTFFDKMRVHIIQCDDQVREDVLISSKDDLDAYMQNFEVLGFGGTDFRPAFAHIEGLMDQGALPGLKGILYFTDGYGIYPHSRPKFNTAFVFPYGHDEARKIPAWAMSIELPYELQIGDNDEY